MMPKKRKLTGVKEAVLLWILRRLNRLTPRERAKQANRYLIFEGKCHLELTDEEIGAAGLANTLREYQQQVIEEHRRMKTRITVTGVRIHSAGRTILTLGDTATVKIFADGHGYGELVMKASDAPKPGDVMELTLTPLTETQPTA